ncbi:MAG: HAMP domain-containing histidine kinase [Spirochaetales bacterium]|nr:HAMP domain-containing histidine kinase [Spirochaetales bacterium]
MDRLLKGLLHLSRIGRQVISIIDIDMNELLSKIISTMKHQILEKNIDIQVKDIPPCRSDHDQLWQVFGNLLENAMKYLDSGRLGKITISGETEKNQTVYCVEDNGIGIQKNHQQKIFEMFHQLDPSRDGIGLGLTIVKRIVERLGGNIMLDSTAGIGSKFYVMLPDRISVKV